jgi:glycosyltransferase involved in cell wall biosynthesis
MALEKTPDIVPKISVVTVNLNRCSELADTIKSVLAQSYPNIEYLVIDGGSDDGSVELIEQFGPRIHHCVSESDRGIYDAMNKGARAATGEWVIFMNAGDRFHDDTVVADVFAQPHDDADLVYGHTLLWYAHEGVGKFIAAESTAALPLRMNCSHQSLFARRSLLISRPFSLDLMVADYEFIVRMHKENRSFKIVDRIVSVYVNGGISDLNRLRSLAQRWRVSTRYGLMTLGGSLRYAIMALKAGPGPYIKRILPRPLAVWILRRKRMD